MEKSPNQRENISVKIYAHIALIIFGTHNLKIYTDFYIKIANDLHFLDVQKLTK